MRMFIASPVKLTREIEDIIKVLSGNKNLRVTEPNNFHLTYLFLGDVNIMESNRITSEMKNISGKKFGAKISGMTAFPDIYHPKVIALVLESQFFEVLYNSILKRLPEYKNSNRGFLPHITIARVRNRGTMPWISHMVIQNETLGIDRICLFKSTLTREGPIYESIYCNEFH
ncbi:RNA 2',3'-cyclic phosphodiesterase [Ferroplasma sp.]|uniref:RNA 2',3'-cyclic phosphodiesterase n=1 Tax=Ferroplasma sp. TaxID=2591003 RepID=UPI0026358175|nr:RNA 2',3'-cyclic phosphodiesterase [Ferroplasma sp.]